MPANFTRKQHGDAYDSASVSGQIENLRSQVNGFAAADVARGAFRNEHLPEPVSSTQWTELYAGNTSLAGAEVYNTHFGNVAPSSYNFQTFGTQTSIGALAAPYGPPTAADIGWRIPARQGLSGEEAECVFASTALTDYAGLWVRGNVELRDLVASGTITTAIRLAGAFVGIGFSDASGRHVVERSIRPYSYAAFTAGDANVACLITQEDLTTYGDGTIQGLFLVFCADILGSGTQAANFSPEISNYNIGFVPVRAGSL